ncbi:MAG: TetR family transcriptional regulator [Planctomycetes bacterium]|nr:TetR family transcriptional regulator [Planctomycetota bacterium]
MASSKREHLIDIARRLFYRDGFHNTGIDAIIAEAGVAKMTLYKYFKSKDELILACLHRQDEEFRNGLMQRVEKQSSEPRERLLALYTIIASEISSKDFCGCLFINAAAEYGKLDNPIHQAAVQHKHLCHQYIVKLATDAGANDPEELACQLCILLEGSIVSAQVTGECSTSSARNAAELLIDHAISAPAHSA